MGKNRKEELLRRRDKQKNEESTITFLVFRTVPRGFLCVLATPRRTQFFALKTKMREKVLGRSALTEIWACSSTGAN
jgi:hypothetical protein